MHLVVVVVTCYKVHKFRNHSENEINEIHFWEPREWKSSAPNLLPGLAGCRQLYRVCLPCRQYWGFFKGDNHHSYLGLFIPPQILVLLDGFCTLNLCLEGAQMKTVFIILMSPGWTGTTTPVLALQPSWGIFFLFWTDLLWLCLCTSQFGKESSMWQDSRKIFWVQSHLYGSLLPWFV